MMHLTVARRSLLVRAMYKGTCSALNGTSLLFENQFGADRQVYWALDNRFVRKHGGRVITTRAGMKLIGVRNGI